MDLQVVKKVVVFTQYNTIDVDTNDKETIDRILYKINKCIHLKFLSYKPSLQKGFHFKMFCDIKCEICRICYDDDIRFSYDNFRPAYSQNVMFDTKEFFRSKNKK